MGWPGPPSLGGRPFIHHDTAENDEWGESLVHSTYPLAILRLGYDLHVRVVPRRAALTAAKVPVHEQIDAISHKLGSTDSSVTRPGWPGNKSTGT